MGDLYAATVLKMMRQTSEKMYVHEDLFRDTLLWHDDELDLLELSAVYRRDKPTYLARGFTYSDSFEQSENDQFGITKSTG